MFHLFLSSISFSHITYREALAAEPLEHFVHRFGGLRQHRGYRGGRRQMAVGPHAVQGGCQQSLAQEPVVAALCVRLLHEGDRSFQHLRRGRGQLVDTFLAVLFEACHLRLVPRFEHRFSFERDL